MNRQFEIPLTTQYYFSIPATVKGRITTEDFISFDFDESFPNDNYDVVVQGYDGKFKIVGSLEKTVILPHVRLPYESTLLVLHRTDPTKPKYIGTVKRGKTYSIAQDNLVVNDWKILR